MRRRSRILAGVVGLVLAVSGCTAKQADEVVPRPSPSPSVMGGAIAAYTSTELGSEESFTELDQLKAAGFDTVIAYGSMNGRTLDGTQRYLDSVQHANMHVVFSVKDVLGTTDTDEVNAEHHRQIFGNGQDQSTDAQVDTVIRELLGHPAVTRVLIADEQPGGPEDLQEWLPRLKRRYEQISKVKPVSVVMYWNPESSDFYRAVTQYADDLQIDYYPLPENATYGPVSAIADIGQMLWQTAGNDGWFVLQAFGWDPEAHPEGISLGFTEKSPPPTIEQMVDMARRAVQGHGDGGAMNLAFYAVGESNAASLSSMTEAIRQIRAADWWRDRGK